MTTKLPPLPKPEDWRKTNPSYQYSPPVTSKDGKTAWIDGGKVFDLARDFAPTKR